MSRVQVILSDEEALRLKGQAQRDGQSLSAWMREAALTRLHDEEARSYPRNRAEMETLFAECDRYDRQGETEPHWDEHLAAIEASRLKGLPES